MAASDREAIADKADEEGNADRAEFECQFDKVVFRMPWPDQRRHAVRRRGEIGKDERMKRADAVAGKRQLRERIVPDRQPQADRQADRMQGQRADEQHKR